MTEGGPEARAALSHAFRPENQSKIHRPSRCQNSVSGSALGEPQFRFNDPARGHLRDDQSRARGLHAKIACPTGENSSDIRHKLAGFQPTKHYGCRHDELVTTTSSSAQSGTSGQVAECGLTFCFVAVDLC